MNNPASSHRKSLFYSLRVQIFTGFLLLFILCLVATIFIYLFGFPFTQFNGIIKKKERETFAELNLLADLKKERLENWVKERRVDMALLTKTPLLLDSLQIHFETRSSTAVSPADETHRTWLVTYLNELHNFYRELEEVRIVDLKTGLILASSIKTGPTDIDPQSYYELFPPGVEENISLRREKGRLFLLIHRLFDIIDTSSGQPRPIVCIMKIDTDAFIRPMLHTGEGLGETGEVLLVTDERRIITSLKYPLADGSAAELLTYRISAEPATFAAKGHEGQISALDYRGVPVLAAYRYIQVTAELGWGMVVKIDRHEVLAPLREDIITLLSLISVACVLIVVVSLFISNRLSATVSDLVRVAGLVESGDLSVRIRETGNDEIGGLSRSFNRMVDHLQRWNEELEHLVEERTMELHQSAEQLRINEFNLKKSQEIARLGSWGLDLEKNRLTWSDETCRIYGVTSESFGGSYQDYLTFVHPDDRQEVEAAFQDTLENRVPFEHSHRIVTSDGKTRIVLEKSEEVIDETGKVIHSYGFVQDITEQKRIEQERKELELRLAQAQKMEAIGTLAGGIAHDFNNILSVIIGYSDLAKMDVPKDSVLYNDLDKVLEAGNRAKDLVRQILAFSRQTNIERIPLRLHPLVKEGLKMLRSSLPTTITIESDIDARCGVVLADPTQIHQILMNLCTNAGHAMESRGGILRVCLKQAKIQTNEEQARLNLASGEYVLLTVSDTGVGIPPEVVGKIFEPYFTTKEINKGTGMGLSIVHGIVTEYGGAITVDSPPGKGTTISVYLPVTKKELSAVPDRIETIPPGSGHILLVDDERQLVEMGKDTLERLGYQVTACLSSFEALTLFKKTPDQFDALVTDQTMPGMTGVDLSRRILLIRPELPIILCTGYSSQIDETSAKVIGIKEFALKPLVKDDLARLLHKVLS